MNLWIILAKFSALILIPLNWAEVQLPDTFEVNTGDQVVALVKEHKLTPAPVTLVRAESTPLPNFSSIKSSVEKKDAFYNYLLPMIHQSNQEVMLERRWLLSLNSILLAGKNPAVPQIDELGQMEKRYLVPPGERGLAGRIGILLKRVDVVPASLIVAQAAKESGWGTSRFATEGNNFFGIWCFYKGCGLKPQQRGAGLNHEVATFESVEQGVRYYVRTINTHLAYEKLRQIRVDARRRQVFPLGEQLANGLIRYSERGSEYVKEIQSMIRFNKLQRFTKIYQV